MPNINIRLTDEEFDRFNRAQSKLQDAFGRNVPVTQKIVVLEGVDAIIDGFEQLATRVESRQHSKMQSMSLHVIENPPAHASYRKTDLHDQQAAIGDESEVQSIVETIQQNDGIVLGIFPIPSKASLSPDGRMGLNALGNWALTATTLGAIKQKSYREQISKLKNAGISFQYWFEAEGSLKVAQFTQSTKALIGVHPIAEEKGMWVLLLIDDSIRSAVKQHLNSERAGIYD